MKKVAPAVAALLFSSVFAVAQSGCDDSTSVKEPSPDTGAPDTASFDGGSDAPDCFMNPTTHFEIINACTNAVKITKKPVLPKLLPDSGLPPLQ